MKHYPLPHFEERRAQIDMLVFHSSAHSGEGMFHCLNKQKLSAHYIVDENGDIIKSVDEKYRAYHAGVSYWRGIEDINSHSIGIEISSFSLGQKKYNPAQIAALQDLSIEIIKRYKIPAANIVGHSDIAPLRKPDPGMAFPWKQLAQTGIGLWYNEEDTKTMPDKSPRELLDIIGYDTRSPEALCASAYAFCRHYIPSYVKKIADPAELVQNFLPEDYHFMQQRKFLKILQAVAKSFQKG